MWNRAGAAKPRQMKGERTMKKVTEYIEVGRRFTICKAENMGAADGYWAFEDKDIDTDGKLKKQFNGINGFHTESLNQTIERVSQSIKVDALVAAGMDRMAAAIMVVCGR